MKINEVLSKSIHFFKEKKIESARLDAEIIISHALKIDRMGLYLKYDQPLTESEINLCRELIKRRSLGEPVAYIVKEKGFYGLNFTVDQSVLIPRPETEIIVDVCLSYISKNKIQCPRILDLGAGSGCIGMSILKQVPSAQLVAVEKSEFAQTLFLKNAEQLQLSERIDLVKSDVESVVFQDLKKFNCIVSNPPYIDRKDSRVEWAVRKYEPDMALFAEDLGFSYLKSWSSAAKENLTSEGLMIFEMGLDQGFEMSKHFHSFKFFKSISILKDLSGLDRFIKAIR